MGPAPHHARSAEETVAALATSAENGLSSTEAAARLAKDGPNALPEAPTRSTLAVFLAQLKSPLIGLLGVAAVVTFALGHGSDALVIGVVVLLNSIIGALQEGRAERSLRALRTLSARRARVLRDGAEGTIDARELVAGDVLVLDAGDAITADARVLEARSAQVSEAALTGESVPVAKHHEPVAPEVALADRRSMLYAGTHLATGRARGVVVATGPRTEIGAIAALAEAAEQPKTPLERRIDAFGKQVMIAAAVLFALILGLGLARGLPLGDIAMIGISQVVGLIPEGLPVAMTIALAVGVQRMAKRRAIVRRLAAVETLGSTTVIASDKTGTLTKNQMTVTAIVLADGRTVAPADARALLEAAALACDARLEGGVGDPTELAILEAARGAGIEHGALAAAKARVAELPFDPAAKLMATAHEGGEIFVKGAPEALFALCAGPVLRAEAELLAAQALRVLAVGVADGPLDPARGFAGLAGRVRLLGLLGQMDPPRDEVKDAVERARSAGIRPVMVTGDHKATGLAIARTLGIAREGSLAIDGPELERMDDAALDAALDRVAVFARVHPAQKLRIVAAYQRRGEVVAMTGDGVNDAPALVKADVGVAMGKSGTDVAKEAAKIVLADDDFGTIVAAVEEGRVVYANIKKAVLLLLSTSIAEVAILVLALLFGYPPPFLAVQILWNNLVTEGLVTVNLVLDPPEGDEMRRAPTSLREALLDRATLARLAFMVPTITAVTLGWLAWRTSHGVPHDQVQTEAFTLLALCEWFNVLNCRSATHSALNLGLLKNRWLLGGLVAGNLLQAAVVFWRPLGELFHTAPFGLREVLLLGVAASLVLWVEELRKLVVRRRATR